MKKLKKQGFTLTELITTITIVSIVLGIATAIIINIIKNSKEETTKITISNVLKSATAYADEYNKDIYWFPNTNNNTNDEKQNFSCISVEELINKGLIKKEVKEQLAPSNFVIIWKNKDKTTIAEELDTEEVCINSLKKVDIPTTQDYCYLTLKYNGTKQSLIKKENPHITAENYMQTNAGNYTVTFKLKNGYTWSDKTTQNKSIVCSISKVTPRIQLNPKGSIYKEGQTIYVDVKSDTAGTLSTTSSNTKYFESSTIEGKSTINENELNTYKQAISVYFPHKLGINGKVTVKLTPKDLQNYNITEADFTITTNTSLLQKVASPTCKPNIYYNQEIQTLTTKAPTGVTLYNHQQAEIGTHEITASLDYGYMWEDETDEDKTLNCEILAPTYTITYNGNGNTGGNTQNSIHTYNISKPLNTNGYTKTGYTFTTWNTKQDGTGISYDDEEIINNLTIKNNDVITLYAQWIPNTYKVHYVGNGNNLEDYTNETHCTTDNKCGLDRYTKGSTFNQTTQTFEHNAIHKYNNKFNLIINRFSKQGYTFAGWSTTPDEHVEYLDGEEVNNLTTDNNAVINLYARWNSNSYNIAYELNKGTFGSNAPTSATYDSTILINNPSRQHTITYDANNTGATINTISNTVIYSFAGWTASNINTNTAMYGASVNNVSTIWNDTTTKVKNIYFKNLTSTNNNVVTLTANWTPRSTNLATITKSGHTCTWNTKSDGTGTSYNQNSNYTPTADITLYAICKPNTYNISYELNGGTKGSSSPTTANYDTIVNISNPTKSYTILYTLNNTGATISTSTQIVPSIFDGWTAQGLDTQNAKYGTSSSNVTSIWNNANTKIKATYFTNLAAKTNNNITLTANWTNDSTQLANVTKSGHTCTWNTKSDGTGTSYNPNASYTPTANITLYAICKPNKVIFKFNTNGGTIKSQTTTANGSTTFNWSQNTNGTIKLSNIETFWTQSYNATSVNLPNYNNSNYMYITKDGLVAIPSAEWNSKPDGTGTSYSHDATYKASDFCDASQSTCTVTLYVNWAKIMYLCVSDSSTSWAAGGTTYMRPKASFAITGHVLITGTPVIVFGTATEDSRFYHIELPEAYRGNSYVYSWAQYYMENATNLYRGYIYKGCLLPNPISKDNYCSPSACTG